MIRNIVAWLGALLAAAWLVCAPLDAWAQGKRMVEPGKQVVLVDLPASTPISVASAAHGRADVQTSSDGQHSTLVYTAPASGTADDVVTYTTSGVSTTIGIAVAKAEAPGKTLTDADTYAPTFKVLFAIFVLAVVLESGLAVLFNWRPFLMTFDARGVKTLVSLAFSLLFVLQFGLDLSTGLVNILWAQHYPASGPGYFITALVLAGGSSGVNNLMVALGFRSVKTAETVVPKPPATQAWIAVSLKRKVAVGPVYVLVTQDGGPKMVVGSISGSSPKNLLATAFLRDKGRFPSWGGFAVEPGKKYIVELAGRDAGNNACTSRPSDAFVPAAGALVDITLEL